MRLIYTIIIILLFTYQIFPQLDYRLESGHYNQLHERIIPLSNLDYKVEYASVFETLENKEGSIVTFENDLMVKFKTAWYFVHHKLLTEDANREDYIIKMIVENKIDDILSQLDTDLDKEKIDWINEIIEQVQKYIRIKSDSLKELVSEYKGDIREFAIKNNSNKMFGLAILVIKRNYSVFDAVCHHVLNSTDKLMKAREFLNKI